MSSSRISLDVLNIGNVVSTAVQGPPAAASNAKIEEAKDGSTVIENSAIDGTASVDDNVLDLFTTTQAKPTVPRSTFIPGDDYEQVSVRSILSRLRPQKGASVGLRDTAAAPTVSSNAVGEGHNEAANISSDKSSPAPTASLSSPGAPSIERKRSAATDSGPAIEQSRALYTIEVPKTGMLDRDEYLTPIYLPTACDVDSAMSANNVKTAVSYTTEDYSARTTSIKTMVYCYDALLMEQYKEKNNTVGIKTNWGLSFESHFECGNLFRADSVIQRGQPLGGVEEYDLYLHPDPSPKPREAHSQWFFFRVSNTLKRTYRFNILNMNQPVPALQQGMRPVMLSEATYKDTKQGWTFFGEDLSFRLNSKNNDPYDVIEQMGGGGIDRNSKQSSSADNYTFSFTVSFAHAKDTVYIALTPPYTYTQLQNMIYLLARSPDSRTHLKVTPLCRTLAGNRCDLLTITENGHHVKDLALGREELETLEQHEIREAMNSHTNTNSSNTGRQVHFDGNSSAGAQLSPKEKLLKRLQQSGSDAAVHEKPSETMKLPRFLQKIEKALKSEEIQEKNKIYEQNRKKFVFITARIHGGECASSWICEGLVKFLLGNSPTAEELRREFVFHVVPMMNPDGVVNGFSRSDIVGSDLNVQFLDPSMQLHPSVFYFNQLMKQVQQRCSIIGCIDLHSQAVKDGICLYGVVAAKSEAEVYAEKLHAVRHSNHQDELTNQQRLQQQRQRERAKRNHLDPRVFFLQAARRSDAVLLRSCSLAVGNRKLNTQRSVAAKKFYVPLSLCVESSCFRRRSIAAKASSRQFVSSDHARFGCTLCISLHDVQKKIEAGESSVEPAKSEVETDKGDNLRPANPTGTQQIRPTRRGSQQASTSSFLSAGGTSRTSRDSITMLSKDIASAMAAAREAAMGSTVKSMKQSAERSPSISISSVRRNSSISIGGRAHEVPDKRNGEDGTGVRNMPLSHHGKEELYSTGVGPYVVSPRVGEASDPTDDEVIEEEDLELMSAAAMELQQMKGDNIDFNESCWEAASDNSDGDIKERKPKSKNSKPGDVEDDALVENLNRKISELAIFANDRSDKLELYRNLRRGEELQLLDDIKVVSPIQLWRKNPRRGVLQLSNVGVEEQHTDDAIESDKKLNRASFFDRVAKQHPTAPTFFSKNFANKDSGLATKITCMVPHGSASPVNEQIIAPTPRRTTVANVNFSATTTESITKLSTADSNGADTSANAQPKVTPNKSSRSPSPTPRNSKRRATISGSRTTTAKKRHEKKGFANLEARGKSPTTSDVAPSNNPSSASDHNRKDARRSSHLIDKKTEVLRSKDQPQKVKMRFNRLSNTKRKSNAATADRMQTKALAGKALGSDRGAVEFTIPYGAVRPPSPSDSHDNLNEASDENASNDIADAVVDSVDGDAEERDIDDVKKIIAPSIISPSTPPVLESVPTTDVKKDGADGKSDDDEHVSDQQKENISIPSDFPVGDDAYVDGGDVDPLDVNRQVDEYADRDTVISGTEIELSTAVDILNPDETVEVPNNLPEVHDTSDGPLQISGKKPPVRETNYFGAGDFILVPVRVPDEENVRLRRDEEIADSTVWSTKSNILFSDESVNALPTLAIPSEESAPRDPVISRELALEAQEAAIRAALRAAGVPLTENASDKAETSAEQIPCGEGSTSAPVPDSVQARKEKFLHDMGLDYNYLFGANGIIKDLQSKKSINSSRNASRVGPKGSYSKAFPQRRPVYEDSIALVPSNLLTKGLGIDKSDAKEEHQTGLTTVHHRDAVRGLTNIKPPRTTAVYVRHQLHEFYDHVHSSLKERQLVDESELDITARRVFELLHTVHALDEEEERALHLKQCLWRQWKARMRRMKCSSVRKSCKVMYTGDTDSQPENDGQSIEMGPVQPPDAGNGWSFATGEGLESTYQVAADAIADTDYEAAAAVEHVATESEAVPVVIPSITISDSPQRNCVAPRVQLQVKEMCLSTASICNNHLSGNVAEGDRKDDAHLHLTANAAGGRPCSRSSTPAQLYRAQHQFRELKSPSKVQLGPFSEHQQETAFMVKHTVVDVAGNVGHDSTDRNMLECAAILPSVGTSVEDGSVSDALSADISRYDSNDSAHVRYSKLYNARILGRYDNSCGGSDSAGMGGRSLRLATDNPLLPKQDLDLSPDGDASKLSRDDFRIERLNLGSPPSQQQQQPASFSESDKIMTARPLSLDARFGFERISGISPRDTTLSQEPLKPRAPSRPAPSNLGGNFASPARRLGTVRKDYP